MRALKWSKSLCTRHWVVPQWCSYRRESKYNMVTSCSKLKGLFLFYYCSNIRQDLLLKLKGLCLRLCVSTACWFRLDAFILVFKLSMVWVWTFNTHVLYARFHTWSVTIWKYLIMCGKYHMVQPWSFSSSPSPPFWLLLVNCNQVEHYLIPSQFSIFVSFLILSFYRFLFLFPQQLLSVLVLNSLNLSPCRCLVLCLHPVCDCDFFF